MARKVLDYKVTDEGRDKGKTFRITEMSAAKAEAWATRVLLALLGSNPEVPEDVTDLGMAQLAELGFKALSGLKWEVAEPLLAEMFDCISVLPDPNKPMIVRSLTYDDSDIEEVSTRLKLRGEIFKLHTDFLRAVAPSMFPKMAAAFKPKDK
jgi:hypothetical protein